MVGPPSGLKENQGGFFLFTGGKENMHIDPANILVACIFSAFVALVIFLKKASDKADKEIQDRKERK